MTPDMSVVVIGRNEGARLSACLHSIRAARFPGAWEVIYVDSASGDDSLDRAQGCAAIVALTTPPFTAARARNAGLAHARGECVLFLDGDTTLHPDFPNVAWQALRTQPHCVAVWGHRREAHPEASMYQRVLDLDWRYPPGVSEFCGGDVLMSRAAIRQAGGFDETLIAGEEPELCWRLRQAGGVIWHVDAPMTTHDLCMTRFAQYWRRALRAGVAYFTVSRRTRSLWLAESRRNGVHALVSIGWLLSVLISLAAGAPLVALGLGGLAVAAVLRSARRARSKSARFSLRLLYAVHSHLQQLPIACGQVLAWWQARSQQPASLIEYKT